MIYNWTGCLSNVGIKLYLPTVAAARGRKQDFCTSEVPNEYEKVQRSTQKYIEL
jgi:hypothetical protein